MDKFNKKYVLSYPDSIKLLMESVKKNDAIRKLMETMLEDNEKLLIKSINKCLYETAEKMGVSLYHLCFHTVPEYEYEGVITSIKLAPVEFDLIHDGGYWKQKYYELKDKMQETIDEV